MNNKAKITVRKLTKDIVEEDFDISARYFSIEYNLPQAI